jgi:hypothetical protein
LKDLDMKLALMQPYFFPYLGYFDLINISDRWIVFDSVQYIQRGWINRNRILHPKEGWQYIIVPRKKHGTQTAIKDVEVSTAPKWPRRILAQIQHYQKGAPYYGETYQLVEECLAVKESSLSRLNVAILEKVCRYLGMSFHYEYFSEMVLELGPVEGPGDWALRIAASLGAKEYVNPPGGKTIFDPSRFQAAGIKLNIRNLPHMEYNCRGYNFVPDLSIIDVLMWNPPEKVKGYLDEHRT